MRISTGLDPFSDDGFGCAVWRKWETSVLVQPAMIPLSVLDLSPIVAGSDASDALRRTRELAQHVERLGYRRLWLAEHHNMPGIASAATSVVIADVAAATTTIRVGSGGVMLPNHAPLVIAEQFGTLAALHPGRIDLGIGRAPGTDTTTARALRRNRRDPVDTFPEDILELQAYFNPAEPDQLVTAVPGAGQDVPIWLLGSSTYSAELAAALGLPFAFAAHFAPDLLMEALARYRARFRPSKQLSQPYAMACIQVIAAESDAEAQRLFTSLQQSFLNLRRGRPGPLPPPVDSMEPLWSAGERAGVEHAFGEAVIGSRETVARGVAAFLDRTKVDELMVTSMVYDHAARLRSFEEIAEVRRGL
jgi:luciferase family oxidoreductase group 1